MIIKLLKNRNFILVLGFILGLLYSSGSYYIKDYILIVLSLMMTVSLTAFPLKDLFPLKETFPIIFKGFLLNYVIFGSILLILSYFLVDDPLIRIGFIFIAVSPAGVVVVPFAIIVNANIKDAAKMVIGSYLFLIIIFPLTIWILYGSEGKVDMSMIFWMMIKLVVVPLFLSAIIRKQKFFSEFVKVRGNIIDWCFFIVVYTVIGLNKQVFLTSTKDLLFPVLVLIIAMFGVQFILYMVLKYKGKAETDIHTVILNLTIKNTGFAAVTSLIFAGSKAAIPAAALSVVLLLYLIYYSFRFGKQ